MSANHSAVGCLVQHEVYFRCKLINQEITEWIQLIRAAGDENRLRGSDRPLAWMNECHFDCTFEALHTVSSSQHKYRPFTQRREKGGNCKSVCGGGGFVSTNEEMSVGSKQQCLWSCVISMLQAINLSFSELSSALSLHFFLSLSSIHATSSPLSFSP